MSSTVWKKQWADVTDDDDGTALSTIVEVDKDGIKNIIEYPNDQKIYRRITRIKTTTISKWTNAGMTARKSMSKFGAAASIDPEEERRLVAKVEEDIMMEVPKKAQAKVAALSDKNEAEDKWYEESLANTENLVNPKDKKVWTDIHRPKTVESTAAPSATPAQEATSSSGAPKYTPPGARDEKGKGKGKGDQQELSLRVNNLSEDVNQGDLQDLFGAFGNVARVYLAQDENRKSKGFAFITYNRREHAELAIQKLNGHGYDNLILQVQWAKPRGQ